MNDLQLFPVPGSGRTVVRQLDLNVIEVSISDMNAKDYRSVLGFFGQMRGRFGALRFAYGSTVYPHCRFDTDAADFEQYGPDSYSVMLPIKILPPPPASVR